MNIKSLSFKYSGTRTFQKEEIACLKVLRLAQYLEFKKQKGQRGWSRVNGWCSMRSDQRANTPIDHDG